MYFRVTKKGHYSFKGCPIYTHYNTFVYQPGKLIYYKKGQPIHCVVNQARKLIAVSSVTRITHVRFTVIADVGFISILLHHNTSCVLYVLKCCSRVGCYTEFFPSRGIS